MGQISNEEIIRIATLELKLDHSISDADAIEFQRQLKRLDMPDDLAMLRMASKLLEGEPFQIASDNPETVARALSLALQLGASIQEEGDGHTHIVFAPPVRQ